EECHSLGADLQRAHHPSVDSARIAGRQLPSQHGRRAAAQEYLHLWYWRRDRAVRWHQADRPAGRSHCRRSVMLPLFLYVTVILSGAKDPRLFASERDADSSAAPQNDTSREK